ncbi:MAG: hypothetical protein A3G32_01755 [Deltaproteobacteria bacterium RIFCSPLOWO2_12_FULL_40_28]|nr:MAG: hypothetical protein A3C45_06500 [Deltaproteobacteria bacterium RIFCSPHIGHO2_02_FULL_40_28]OGQ18857.1 MAG: hypothetical protein A3E27_09135 [Deltaproteobacteria bacterium RIFCSPHIGHO2_12_FULL_40_32]OGQ40102.1 MAG: hypothetical protein A3I69_01665 [Deltaproteobacteria bacterium RIFCSPLOWO2_02_FULL_40_36]OGQ53285.1 MAG: hypothetical protein A3G32_01755 [Deltaproteobacteria bacterium RIFCSPLOWO2_12_FULL_40_28]
MHTLSSLRKQGSSLKIQRWIPTFVGMTDFNTPLTLGVLFYYTQKEGQKPCDLLPFNQYKLLILFVFIF